MDKQFVKVDKPNDWPQNQREANLMNVLDAVEAFTKQPNYKNKEILYALINQVDLNEINEFGLFRITDYEVAIINQLYFDATLINCESLKIYLYAHIARLTRTHKMIYNMRNTLGEKIDFLIKEFSFLMPSLKLFYLCYAYFNYEKTRSFADEIINEVKIEMKVSNKDTIGDVAFAYITMLKDLSNFSSGKVFGILKFTRDELIKLFQLEAELIKNTNQDIIKRPLKGVIKLTIRNWVLKSRNNYDFDLLYKCISTSSIQRAFLNHEVWMQKTELLNDKREGKIIKELYANKTWLKKEWAKKIKFIPLENSFVCSYSKEKPTSKMLNKYGWNVFGYKSDRIADVLTPIVKVKNVPMLEQVSCYDIIYNIQELKEEINYLIELIDLFDVPEDKKSQFLSELLQYWYLSAKDKKWEYEHERRYQLFLFNYKDYWDLKTDERFAKIKTSVYILPDFILTQNEKIKSFVKIQRSGKITNTAMRPYIYCHECTQVDFDDAIDGRVEDKFCPVCGSKNIELISKYK